VFLNYLNWTGHSICR